MRADAAFCGRDGRLSPTSIFRRSALRGANLALLDDESEGVILRLIAQFPRIVDQAAAAREPHRIAFYAHDLATGFPRPLEQGQRFASFAIR